MADRIVMWTTKSDEAKTLPPFSGSLELGDMRLTFDGRVEPQLIKLVFENIPFTDGVINFFNKFGTPGELSGEIVINSDEVTLTDLLPFALQNYCELFLKSSVTKKVEIPKGNSESAPADTSSDDNFMEMTPA